MSLEDRLKAEIAIIQKNQTINTHLMDYIRLLKDSDYVDLASSMLELSHMFSNMAKDNLRNAANLEKVINFLCNLKYL
jgi:hypothetical protein